MALYAFDGSLGSDEPFRKSEDTNVVRFREVYDGPVVYLEGLNLKFDLLSKLVGNTFGSQGEDLVEEAYERLQDTYPEDPNIDIVGYSRGAVLALEFANRIAKKGIEARGGDVLKPLIRFLGLWDTTGHLGLPIRLPSGRAPEINLAKNLVVPNNVKYCYHALALNERRREFSLTRLDEEHDQEQSAMTGLILGMFAGIVGGVIVGMAIGGWPGVLAHLGILSIAGVSGAGLGYLFG